jgi:hypothetical protein
VSDHSQAAASAATLRRGALGPCDGKYAPRHLATVVYTRRIRDLWQRRYWVRCFVCDLYLGPYPDRGFARLVEADLNGR